MIGIVGIAVVVVFAVAVFVVVVGERIAESGCGFVVSKDPGRFGTFHPGGSARGSMRYRYSGPPLDASVDSLPQLPRQVPQSRSEVGPPAPALIHLTPLN